MFKGNTPAATTAIASLLVVACVFTFARWFSGRINGQGIASSFFLALLLILTIAGKRSQRLRRRGTAGMGRFLRNAAPGLLILLAPAVLWAAFGTAFQGVVTLFPTGSITLSGPKGMAVDGEGNVYIVDSGNNQIVEITAGGVASVLNFSGLSLALNTPTAVAVSGSGNLYVADSNNNRVVELSGGVVSVIATSGLTLSYPDGVALDAAGDLYIADRDDSRIVEVAAGGAASVLSITGLSISGPGALAVDVSGNLYIADSNNNRIVVVAPGGAGTVLAITGGTTLSTAVGVAVDPLGKVYISDFGNNRIVTVVPGSAAGSLHLGSFTLNGPIGVAVNASGAIYIADSGNNRILAAQPSAVGFGHLPVGAGSGTTVTLPFTIGFTVTFGSVQAFTQGTPSLDFTVASTTCVPGVTTGAACTVNVTFLPAAAGLRRGAVVIYNSATPNVPILTVPIYGTGDAPLAALAPNTGTVVNSGGLILSNPFQVALDGAGNMYVGDYSGTNVTRISAGGGNAIRVSLGTPGGSAVQNITGVAVDGAGNLFVGDHQNSRIIVVTPGGVVSVLSITGLSAAMGFPTALAFDSAGNLYIADFTNSRIIRVSSLVVVGSTSSGLGAFIGTGAFAFGGSTLTGATVDAQGNIYAAARTQNNSSIIKVTPAGAASELSFPGVTPVITNPQGVAADAMGNIYAVDTGNSRIVRLTTAGLASAVSISGLAAPSTLGGTLFGVTLDPSGNLFIADWTNNRIVFVNVSGAVLAFPNTNVGAASAAQTAAVTNLGDLPLIFSASPGYTVNFSENTGDTDLCTSSTSLSAGTLCDVSVEFTPQSAGSLSVGIVVTNNSLNLTAATQTVAVSGTGIRVADATAVVVSTNPASVVLGQTITITASVTDTTAGHTATIPTGGVTFMDTVGSTTISLNGGTAVALNGAGNAILAGVTLAGAGTHTITANYVGVPGSFATSSNTATIAVAAVVPSSSTTLTIAAGTSVAAGTAAALTATVISNSVPVVHGTVVFCDATAAHCEGSAVFGSAQLTSAGTAAIKLTLGVGVYSIAAAFQATASALASSSTAQPFTVTAAASYPSFTTITASGSAGHYTLSGTVTAFGKVAPSGTVSFLDASQGNASVATAALAPSTLAFGFIAAAGSPLAEPNDPANAVAGDFNNDGIPDVAVVDYETTTVTIFLGKGDGTFQPAVSYNLNDYGYGVAVGDFNGDGKLDLVVASNSTVSVLLGNGDGTFQPETAYTVGVPGNSATGVVVGDFNGDGIIDIAAVNSINSNSASTVSILIGNGDGTFRAQVQYAAGMQPYWVAAGDFNGDGKLDLAVSTAGSQSSVNVLLGNGDGSFQAPVAYAVGARSDYILAADFNKDGRLDLVTANNSNNTVSVFLGNGDGTFQAAVAYGTGSEPADIAVGDFNDDGNLDLAVANYGDNTVSILSGKGDGTFQPQAIWNTGISPWGIVAGDFNGDGLPDLFVANNGDNTDSVLLNEQSEMAMATAVSVSGAGSHNVLASYPGDASRAASESATVSLIGTALPATTTTLIAAPNPALAGQSVTLTATVAPAPTGASAGTVSFYNGVALLGTGTVDSSGIATFTTSGLPAGALSLIAVYSGNSGSAGSTSTAVSESVAPSYTVAGPSAPVAVVPGGAATIDITVPPLGGPFNSVVTLSASGLPPGATAKFNPPTVTPGSAGAATVLTIQLAKLIASNSVRDIHANSKGFSLALFSFGFVLFGAVLGRKRIPRLMPRTVRLAVGLAALSATTLLVTGCGGGFANTPATVAGNYTVKVTGTSGSFQASTTVTLVVK